ncbi:transposase [Ferruginibacter sp.]
MNVIEQLQAEYQYSLNELVKNKTFTTATEYKLQKLYFAKFDRFMHAHLNAPYWLQEPGVAAIIYNSLLHLDTTTIDLYCFTVMSNHVHALFSLKNDKDDLYKVMQSHKSFTAKKCNAVLKREGPFWEPESYDHIVRSGEFDNIVNYILLNPVKAGLVEKWEDWRWTYLKSEQDDPDQ